MSFWQQTFALGALISINIGLGISFGLKQQIVKDTQDQDDYLVNVVSTTDMICFLLVLLLSANLAAGPSRGWKQMFISFIFLIIPSLASFLFGVALGYKKYVKNSKFVVALGFLIAVVISSVVLINFWGNPESHSTGIKVWYLIAALSFIGAGSVFAIMEGDLDKTISEDSQKGYKGVMVSCFIGGAAALLSFLSKMYMDRNAEKKLQQQRTQNNSP